MQLLWRGGNEEIYQQKIMHPRHLHTTLLLTLRTKMLSLRVGAVKYGDIVTSLHPVPSMGSIL